MEEWRWTDLRQMIDKPYPPRQAATASDADVDRLLAALRAKGERERGELLTVPAGCGCSQPGQNLEPRVGTVDTEV